MADRYRCAPAALERDEPLLATASFVHRWILVEQPGPWGRDAARESRMPPAVTDDLLRRAAAARARVVLIRRYGRHDDEHHGRTVFTAVTTPQVTRLERFDLETSKQLRDIDLAPLATGSPVGGTEVAGPVYLVCTNGSHDPCCAEFGRPLAEALTALRPAATWECSHIGGDRFAGNVVCFPGGIYLGRVGPDQVEAVIGELEAGRVARDHYRGRCWYPFHVQAAEHFLRLRTGVDGVDDLRYEDRRTEGDGIVHVTFAAGAQRHRVSLRVHGEEAALLTCRAPDPRCAPRYELLGHERVAS